MAVKPLVIRSIEDETGQRCVDLAVEKGKYGWIECRRDPEESHGWRSLGGVVLTKYNTEDEALLAACESVSWLRAAL